jgi:HK97 family phage major capsid protein
MTARDRESNFARYLIAGDDGLAAMYAGDIDVGLEREQMAEARRDPFAADKSGLVLPWATKGRAGIDSGTSTTGGPFKFTRPGDFIEVLRNKSSVMQAGATVMTGLTGPLAFPQASGTATAAHVGENPGSDSSRSNLVTTTQSIAFFAVQASTAVSRQALFSAASGNYDLENIIKADLAKLIALAVDLGALNGLGSANQPLGVFQRTDIGSVAIGTNGGAPTAAAFIAAEKLIGDANAEAGGLSVVSNTAVRAKCRATERASAHGWLWNDSNEVLGHPAYASNQVPRNLTKGTSTTICSAVLFGAYENLIIGMFGPGVFIIVDPFVLKYQGMVDISVTAFYGTLLRHVESFCAIKDVTTT